MSNVIKVACIIPDKLALQRNTVGKTKWNTFVLKAPLTSINVPHNTRGTRNVLCTGTEAIAESKTRIFSNRSILLQ
jgi:hypothetical protein